MTNSLTAATTEASRQTNDTHNTNGHTDMNASHSTLSYRELQAELSKYGTQCSVKRNSKREVLEAELTRLIDCGAVHEAQGTKATTEDKLSYRALQLLLKGFGSQCTVKRNSKYEVLLAEYNRLMASGAASEEVKSEPKAKKAKAQEQTWADKAKSRGYSEAEAQAMQDIMDKGTAKQKRAVIARLG